MPGYTDDSISSREDIQQVFDYPWRDIFKSAVTKEDLGTESPSYAVGIRNAYSCANPREKPDFHVGAFPKWISTSVMMRFMVLIPDPLSLALSALKKSCLISTFSISYPLSPREIYTHE
jgi:hypothetical protein